MTDGNKEEVNIVPCSFKFHNFVAQVGEVRFSCHIIKMESSLYLWVGDCNDGAMNDLSFALLSEYESLPISTKLMGSIADSTSTSIAKRLAKKTGKPIYVSFNISVDNILLPGIEKRIQEEFKNNTDLLSF